MNAHIRPEIQDEIADALLREDATALYAIQQCAAAGALRLTLEEGDAVQNAIGDIEERWHGEDLYDYHEDARFDAWADEQLWRAAR